MLKASLKYFWFNDFFLCEYVFLLEKIVILHNIYMKVDKKSAIVRFA